MSELSVSVKLISLVSEIESATAVTAAEAAAIAVTRLAPHLDVGKTETDLVAALAKPIYTYLRTTLGAVVAQHLMSVLPVALARHHHDEDSVNALIHVLHHVAGGSVAKTALFRVIARISGVPTVADLVLPRPRSVARRDVQSVLHRP